MSLDGLAGRLQAASTSKPSATTSQSSASASKPSATTSKPSASASTPSASSSKPSAATKARLMPTAVPSCWRTSCGFADCLLAMCTVVPHCKPH